MGLFRLHGLECASPIVSLPGVVLVVMIGKFFRDRVQTPLLVLLLLLLGIPRCPLECKLGSWQTVRAHSIKVDVGVSQVKKVAGGAGAAHALNWEL